MSYYVHGSNLSYLDYIQAKSFVRDIASATEKSGRAIAMTVSNQTREVIASNDALSRNNIMAMEAMTDNISDELHRGFEKLSYGLKEIDISISELNATFHWGFGQVIASMGHMNDALSELIKIAKTPVQTVAFNHFEIARDAFRQRLYQESLDEVQKAIEGDHTSSGYKLEWRFHQLVGTIHLGFADCDSSLIDLAKAEESFLLAARYAKTDFHEEASRAFLSSGWAAYCQGKMYEALDHTEQAIDLNPKLAEALFQAAKVRIALGQVENSLPTLAKAIDLDHFYALKAAGDGDFQKYDEKLRNFLEKLRQTKYQAISERAQNALDNATPWLSRNLPDDQAIKCVSAVRNFLRNKSIPLIDLLEAENGLNRKIDELDSLNRKWKTLKEKHRDIARAAQNALKKIKSVEMRFVVFDRNNAEKRMKTLSTEESNWPILEMGAELDLREGQIFSTLEEARALLDRRFNQKLKERDNKIKLVESRFEDEVRVHRTNRDLTFSSGHGCIWSIIIYFVVGFSAVLFESLTGYFLSSLLDPLFLSLLLIGSSLILGFGLSRLIPPILNSRRHKHASSKIKKLEKIRESKIAKIRKEYNNDPEIISLKRGLESLR